MIFSLSVSCPCPANTVVRSNLTISISHLEYFIQLCHSPLLPALANKSECHLLAQ